MMSEHDTEIADAAQLLERAQQAVNRGDPVEMLVALTASHYLDGLTRRLQKQWGGSLPPHEVDDCIAHAVDAACATAFEKVRVLLHRILVGGLGADSQYIEGSPLRPELVETGNA